MRHISADRRITLASDVISGLVVVKVSLVNFTILFQPVLDIRPAHFLTTNDGLHNTCQWTKTESPSVFRLIRQLLFRDCFLFSLVRIESCSGNLDHVAPISQQPVPSQPIPARLPSSTSSTSNTATSGS